MTRSEYIEWCKVRAREYLDRGDQPNAVASILSDMKEREDTPVNLDLAMIGLMMAMNGDAKGVRKFIEGFK